MAQGREVDPNLMGPARLGKNLKKRETIKPLNHLPPGDRYPAFFGSGGHPFPLTRMSSDGRIDQTFLFTELTIGNGQINLFYGAVFKLIGQLMICLIVFGDDHDTGSIFIQTVDNTWS
jgi:hypothetical protein